MDGVLEQLYMDGLARWELADSVLVEGTLSIATLLNHVLWLLFLLHHQLYLLSMNQQHVTLLVLLDLSAAFDTIYSRI